MGQSRVRLDQRLVELGLAEDEREALALILSGRVRVQGRPVSKPGTLLKPEAEVVVEAPSNRYVSMGGLKLEPILKKWEIVTRDRVCLDIGASTGGFTHCLLQQGARLVYALDVGKGQLDWNLRNDSRVVVLEGINARELDAALFDPPPSLVTIDVSFISVRLILEQVWKLHPIETLVLVKPQFEATREEIPAGGVIQDSELRFRILDRVSQESREIGFMILHQAPSPIKGQKGNQEFFLHLAGATNP